MYDVLLVRYGEIGLKGKNRHQFEERLVRNMRQALGPLGDRPIRRTYGRVFVALLGDAPDVVERLRRVFGIVSLSPAREVALDMEAVRSAALEVLQDALALPAGRNGRPTFKVDARRAYKQFPLDSMAINTQVGAFLAHSVPDLMVDVHRPDVTVRVEVRERGAYVYAAVVPGPGGLPVGVSSRGLLLLSGGIDSPVAGWYGLKRGMALDAVHFHSFPFTGERSRQKVVDLCRALAAWGGPERLFVVRFTQVQKAIQQHCPAALGVTIMRRMMLRIAERIARQEGALALLTGESVGQVASQTLESMAAIEAVTRMPILRPLVGMDKQEIVERAREIETYDISALPYEDCCTLFVPRHPETRPRLDQVAAAEAPLPVESLAEEALAGTEVVPIHAESWV